MRTHGEGQLRVLWQLVGVRNWTGSSLAEGDGCTLLPISVTLGRGGPTDAVTLDTRPSFSVTFALTVSPGFRAAVAWAILCDHGQFVNTLMGGQCSRHEFNPLHEEAGDVVQTAALENALRVSQMNAETIQVSGLGVCL